jgi:hypothetical protein
VLQGREVGRGEVLVVTVPQVPQGDSARLQGML